MSKKLWSVLVAGALVASIFTAFPALGASPGEETTFFVRRDACGSEGNPHLALTDGDDASCSWDDQMLVELYTPVFDPADLFPTVDGVPLTLDATRHATGVISVGSRDGAGAGLAELELTLLGETAGEEKLIGEFTESYEAAPATTYTFEFEIEPDPELNGKVFDSLTLRVFSRGFTVGFHGVIELNDPPAFINVPTSGGDVVSSPPVATDPPTVSDPTPKKKNCKKIKNKKKRKKCIRRNKKLSQPQGCAALTPAEQGAEGETFVVTDEATEEEPLEFTVEHGTGLFPAMESRVYANIQVDSQAEEAGLYVRYEFPPYEDHDLFLLHSTGKRAATAAGFNPLAPVEQPINDAVDGEGSGHSEIGAEQVSALRTADCAGYTADLDNFIGEGGEYTVKAWLGEILWDPEPPE